ncbi:MAG: hypothetical protein WC526_03340 [Patescibacteria group bacterium]
MKKVAYLAISVLVSIVLASPTMAATFKGGQEYTLSKNQSINDNLYAAGSNLTIDGNVNGDAFLVGSNISALGTTTKDLYIAGAAINIFGNVGDDLRVAGSMININAPVGGELMVAGAQINISSNISKDVYAAGASVNINGNVNGKLTVRGSDVKINGTISKDVDVIAEKLTIGSGAVINGNLIYKAPKPATVEQGATIKGETKYTEQVYKAQPRAKNVTVAAIAAAWLFKMILSVFAGLILFLIFRKGITGLTVYAVTNFWKELLRGFIIMVVLPVAMIFAAITVLGLPLALIAGLIYTLYFILAHIGAGIILGSLVFKWLSRSPEYKVSWVSAVVGIIMINVIMLIPIIGWLFCLAFCLVAFGTLFYFSYRKFILEQA